MLDVLRREVKVGDRVALAMSKGGDLLTGTVVAFREAGESKVRPGSEIQVTTDRDPELTWRGGSTRWYPQDRWKFIIIRTEGA